MKRDEYQWSKSLSSALKFKYFVNYIFIKNIHIVKDHLIVLIN